MTGRKDTSGHRPVLTVQVCPAIGFSDHIQRFCPIGRVGIVPLIIRDRFDIALDDPFFAAV